MNDVSPQEQACPETMNMNVLEKGWHHSKDLGMKSLDCAVRLYLMVCVFLGERAENMGPEDTCGGRSEAAKM